MKVEPAGALLLMLQECASYGSVFPTCSPALCFLSWDNAAREAMADIHITLLTSVSLELKSISVSYPVTGILVQQQKETKVGLGGKVLELTLVLTL